MSHLVTFLVLISAVPAGDASPRPAGPAGQVILHVSPDGDDGADGTADRPFATPAHAQRAVREQWHKGRRGEVTVLLHEGTYILREPLMFGPEDSPPHGASVTYAGPPAGTAVLSGGRQITDFKMASPGRWVANLPEVQAGQLWFRQLFVDGQRKPRARFPNAPDLLRVKAVSENVRRVTFEEPLPAGDLASQDAELVVYQNWSISRGAITASDANSVTTATPTGWIGHGAMTTTSPGKPALLEHALAFLDQPGEWYLDRATGVLTLLTAESDDPNRHTIIAPVLEQLVVMRGTREKPLRDIHFRGLTFAYTEWPLPPFGYNGIQAGHHGTRTDAGVFVLPAAIEWSHAFACGMERCRVLHTGASGIALGPGCRDNRIVGCEVADAGGNGIMIGRRTDAELGGMNGPPGLANDWANPADVPAGNVVDNCFVHACAAVNHGCVGIYDAFCKGTRITHNLIRDLPYTGVSIGYRWDSSPTTQQDCLVAFNDIHDVMNMLADGGAIYTLGWQPGTVLRGNHLHAVHRSGFAHGGAPNNGIFFDQGSKAIHVQENIIHDTSGEPIRFNQCGREDLTWADNALGVKPSDAEFPKEIVGQAGLQAEFRDIVGGSHTP